MKRRVLRLLSRASARAGWQLVPSRSLPIAHVKAFCENIRARGFEPRVIFDVGANRGAWSREVRDVFPDACYTLIEPQIELKPFLDAFCSEAPSAQWINAAAGPTEGERAITLFRNDASSTFAVTDEQAQRWGLEQRPVPVVTLDGVCSRAGVIPDLVKLDVEGFEHEVLRGASSLFGRTELFLIELTFFRPHANGKTFAEMVGLMSDLGYQPYDFTTFQRRPYDGAVGLCELAFARNDGYLRSHKDWR